MEPPPIPRGPDGAPVASEPTLAEPTFSEPWQAQAFALTLALHERGLFTWSEWADALGAEIRRAGRDGGEGYYQCWLSATERLAAAKGATTPAELDGRRAAWDRAVRATPHGEPIALSNDPALAGAAAGEAGGA